ncbi:hydroxyethylthiazole kinase [Hymenobacter sp. NST-14]|uniref:hydroxyethylthiazole kinase n=1 Tax=Hymenobacter piscis TaxID=2839984 RepID=UPI001C017EC3|nr:hydroxyethylthiazole kinase [Hymenobacter piscis]MBT9394845.1 hydroxyethylthiazole kinase [Hymenobacter piscis]
MQQLLWPLVQAVRTQSPLVHNITNLVVMNNTANALLAVGASPIMAHAHAEVAQLQTICQALVLNIGTLDEYWVEAMLQAAAAANALGRPWVLDPVGAGATAYRDDVLRQLLALRPTIIRGNASEILALARHHTTATKGVDSTAASTEAVTAARQLSAQWGSVVCVSGETDIVVDGTRRADIANGSPLLTRVTGMGCSASAVLGALAAVAPPFEAAVAGVALFSLSGELAATGAAGPGSLQVRLLDTLHSLTEAEFTAHLRLRVW